jgi:hypothetical protein
MHIEQRARDHRECHQDDVGLQGERRQEYARCGKRIVGELD